jgi:futalosine hydrolase
MNIAIVAATEFELNGIAKKCNSTKHNIETCVHGVGLMASTYHLTKLVKHKPNLIIQLGIAGSYTKSLQLGEVVFVKQEILGDTGAEGHNELLDLFDLELQEEDVFPFKSKMLENPMQYPFFNRLKKVRALTVALAAGTVQTIEWRQDKFKAQIESMEGAALHYICLQENINFVQCRGISNYVEPRNKANWQIPQAIANCQQEVLSFIQSIS